MPIGYNGSYQKTGTGFYSPNRMKALLQIPFSNKSSKHDTPALVKQFKKMKTLKKQIHDIIEGKQTTDNEDLVLVNAKASVNINQKNQKTYLNQLYNQDIAPEDSQKTLFYYLKTLAYQMIIVLLSFIGIFFAFVMYYDFIPGFSDYEGRETITLITAITMITAFLQTQTRIQWLKQKKQKQNSAKDEYIALLIELILLIPCPNNFITGQFTLFDTHGENTEFNIDEIFTVFILGRVIYFYKFIIHCQLYYGSRPDRLSRLYTVKFGTFNAFKFLINEKPLLIVVFMFSLNLFFLPVLLLLIQGKVNPSLSTFMACLHYTVVTQVTVGYGNILVVTILGRIVSISFILIGVTTTSLLLIFFMRLMEQQPQQQEAYLLLSSLQKRQEITRARILRIQTQYLWTKNRCTPQQKQKNEEKLRQFRFQNRQDIRFHREQPANVKRMMLSNFSAVSEMLNDLKQKQSILAKMIQFLIKPNNQTHDKMLEDSTLSQEQINKILNHDKNKLSPEYSSKYQKKMNESTETKKKLSFSIKILSNNVRQNIIGAPLLSEK